MKGTLGILVVGLVTSGALLGEDTFESVQDGFRRRVVELLHEQQVPTVELEERLGELAAETFGAHPQLLRREAEERFSALPVFPEDDLGAWEEHASWGPIPALPPEAERQWLLVGWDPRRIASWGSTMLLSRELDTEEFSRRAVLSSYCPDEVYRLGAGDPPDLVLDSLGDLFVIRVEWTDDGVCRPVSLRWLKRR
jgi:hypothetical protein